MMRKSVTHICVGLIGVLGCIIPQFAKADPCCPGPCCPAPLGQFETTLTEQEIHNHLVTLYKLQIEKAQGVKKYTSKDEKTFIRYLNNV